jgi:hypothetical protein
MTRVIAVTLGMLLLAGCASWRADRALPTQLPAQFTSCAPAYSGWYVYPPHNYCYPAHTFYGGTIAGGWNF